MTPHDELKILYGLRRTALTRAVERSSRDGYGVAGLADLIEERERRILDAGSPVPSETARLISVADAQSRVAA